MSDNSAYENKSIEELRKIINTDTTNYMAQYILAEKLIKLKSENIKENQQEAFELLNRIVKNNKEHLPAWHLLGCCYEKGFGTKQNIEEAITCYVIASKINDYDTVNGYAPSQYKMARIYEEGKYSFKKDTNKAYELYYLSAKNKYLHSKYRLALCYERGIGIKQDIIKSKFILEDLVKNGYEKAQKSLNRVIPKLKMGVKTPLILTKKPTTISPKPPVITKKRLIITQKNPNLVLTALKIKPITTSIKRRNEQQRILNNIEQANNNITIPQSPRLGTKTFICPNSPR